MWVKGKSGNPGGRPKIPEPFKQHGPQAVKKIIKLMNCGDNKIEFMAAQLVAHFVYGKPKETIQLDATENFAELLAGARQRVNGPETF